MRTEEDIYFMQLALEEAKKAYAAAEVPVGALIVHQGEVIARAHNRVEQRNAATSHAELLVLMDACQQQGDKYLPDCTLYVTLEPCAMCAGACYWTQLGRLVFGAKDPKRGYKKWSPCLLHPKTIVSEGILAIESRALLQKFFKNLRKK